MLSRDKESKNCITVKQGELRDYPKARLKVFCEEELDGPFMLLNEVLGQGPRIDRIVRQPQGPPLLRGGPGAGKTTLVRSGCKDEKKCSIFNEPKVVDSGFVERMNPLGANGEVLGRLEGDKHTPRMTQCKEAAQRQWLMLIANKKLCK